MTLTSGQSHAKPISAFALISWGAHGHTHASQTTSLARRAVYRGAAAGRGARVPVPKSVAQRLVYLPCFFKAQTVVQGFTGNERLRQNEERIWRQLFLVPFGGEELIEVPFNLVIQGVVVYPRQSVVVFVHFYPISIRFNRFFNSIGQFPLLHQWC